MRVLIPLPDRSARSATACWSWRAPPTRPPAADADRQFERGPVTLTARGTATDDGPAFTVADGRYLSARWPGDACLFGRQFRDLLQARAGAA